ncbi:facilitated trehalose transporter Tret1-like isoform X2 [Nylanderia fulva]|uniref:facilitated trehalose transporter Tret1-like isoform X2 n=1 Tax=Nylanderia fulva TaxID=613905 RepID=UPI0010FB64CF|nr:facilitated trehalose transporter Tret1-like isoform X2 [Nylanderia fulva]
MDQIQEAAGERTHSTIENNKKLDNETSNFLQQVSVTSSIREKITMTDITPQIIASCIIHCMVIKAGINMAYSTVLVNALKSDNDIKVTEKEESWIASLATITLPIGSIIVGPLMDKFGRKTVCLLSCIPAAISWVLLIFAKSLSSIYVARVIAGIAAGLTTVGLVYISELSHPQVRPMLLCLNSVFVSLGILITCCLTVLVDWRKMSIIFLALECCIFIALYFVPESPYWLVYFTNGMFDEKRICKMKCSLKRLNRRQTIYEQEFSRIMETCGNQANNERSKDIISMVKNYYQQFTSPNVYKPITILFFLFLLQQLSGCYVIIFYALDVFHEMGGTFGKGFDKNDAFIMLDACTYTSCKGNTYVADNNNIYMQVVFYYNLHFLKSVIIAVINILLTIGHIGYMGP